LRAVAIFGKNAPDLPESLPIMPDQPRDLADFQRRWHDYYSDKRILHQWMQVHLLRDLPVRRVLEIGPYLGLVTAMLVSAGYETVTLDVDPEARAGRRAQADAALTGDVRDLDAEALGARGFDAVLCCETLEHLPYADVPGVLARLAAIGAPYLVLSVPYMGSQFSLTLYLNRHRFRKRTALKKFMGFKRFPAPADEGAWEPHKWEIGYRDYPLAGFRALVEDEFRILRTEFTSDCRSVFFLCENRHKR
jgi:SAM-dependent methyltransferase